jgi:hypothetical protein
MANPVVQVRMEGLRELRKAMRDAEAGSQKHLQRRFKDVAAIVASAIAGRVPRGPTGHAAASVRPRATATGASVLAGGASAPYFPWLDFGGSTGRGHKAGGGGAIVRNPFMGESGEGRYVYPTISEMPGVIEHAANEAIGDALTEAGWERD